MAKNVLIKKPNPAASKGYDEIHPITKAGNVYTSRGISLEEMTANRDGYGPTKNDGNAYSVTIVGGATALVEGLRVMVKINANSTGAATLNYNGLGAKAIKKANTSNVTNLKAGSVYTLVYNGSVFMLQGEGGEGDAVSGDIRAGKTAETDIGPVIGSLPVRTGGAVTPGASAIVKAAGIYDEQITIAAVSVPADKLLTGSTVAGTPGTMPNRGAVTITPSALAQTILLGYHNGLGVVAAVTFNPAKVLNDTTIAGTKGTVPILGTHTSSINTAWDGNNLYVRIPNGAYVNPSTTGYPEIIVSPAQARADTNIQAGNIRNGVWMYGLQGNLKPWFGGLISVNFATQAGANGITEEMFRFPAGFTYATFAGSLLFGTSNNNSYQDHSLVLQDNQGNQLLILRHVINGSYMNLTHLATGMVIDKGSRRITFYNTIYMTDFGSTGDIAADGSFTKPFNLDGPVAMIHVVVASLGGGYSTASARGAATWN
ncbi:hypothetical protein ACFWMP_13960 [Paenibacillus sp. NPDC058367]|uniref:hypothetical protein n=1 Tax=Paenibacillus sp. NPDC058367 TaxID=3346460 RepID=UPI00364653CF